MKDFLKDLAWIIGGAVLVTGVSLYFYPVTVRAAEAPLQAHAAAMETKYDLPKGMLRAICEQESRWRNLAGRHGEIGVCQIKPTTVAMVCPECAGNVHRQMFAAGSRGDHVARIQAVLAREKIYTAAIDGVFGPQTHTAVMKFQSKAKVAVDGVVGPQTWGALFGALDPFPGTSITTALWDPPQNIEWAARYLAWIRDNVSADHGVMIAAYNGGPANQVVVYLRQVRGRM